MREYISSDLRGLHNPTITVPEGDSKGRLPLARSNARSRKVIMIFYTGGCLFRYNNYILESKSLMEKKYNHGNFTENINEWIRF